VINLAGISANLHGVDVILERQEVRNAQAAKAAKDELKAAKDELTQGKKTASKGKRRRTG
jgi:hypothetical protein